jgi:small subunit ribosomal protein S16
MLKLRLSRGGTKKRPVYKVVVADSRFARDGRFIEKVGFFNPLLPKEKKERIGLEAERIKYWLGQGAQPTTRVARILGENELMPMPANGNNPQKAIPKKDRKKEGSEETKKEESPKADSAPAGEAKKEEAPKAEAKKEEAPKAEAKKEEAPKAEAKKEEAPKAEAKKEEAPKAEAKKEEAPKAEAKKEEPK